MRDRKTRLILYLLILFAINVTAQLTPSQVIAMFKNFSSHPNYIMVAAHRGYWEKYPENTLPAFEAAITKGADMVEIDVRTTSDDSLMIYHDLCLNRMTSQRGQLKSFTYSQIKDLKLKDRLGVETDYKILQLSEALSYLKGKIVINFDIKDAGDLYLSDLKKSLIMARKIGVLNQIVVKVPGNIAFEKFKDAIQQVNVTLTDCIFTPVIYATQDYATIFKNYIETGEIYGFELVYKQNSDPLIPYIENAHSHNAWVGQYTFWPEVPEGVLAEDPKTCEEVIRRYFFKNDGSQGSLNDGRGDWDWVMSKGPNFIVSDRPDLWIDYLNTIGKRTP